MKENKKLEYFIDTLNLILLPKMEVGKDYYTIVSSVLKELEGDYYTFLHENNINELVSQEILNTDSAENILFIRKKINELTPYSWNANSFIFSEEWNQIRQITLKIIIEMYS